MRASSSSREMASARISCSLRLLKVRKTVVLSCSRPGALLLDTLPRRSCKEAESANRLRPGGMDSQRRGSEGGELEMTRGCVRKRNLDSGADGAEVAGLLYSLKPLSPISLRRKPSWRTGRFPGKSDTRSD